MRALAPNPDKSSSWYIVIDVPSCGKALAGSYLVFCDRPAGHRDAFHRCVLDAYRGEALYWGPDG